jgi:tetratricopeptide (TPR) repeat protein
MLFNRAEFLDYPMGPHLKNFLKIDDSEYRGDQAPAASQERLKEFSSFLIDYFQDNKPKSHDQFVDLIEEMTSMGLSAVVVQFVEMNAHQPIEGDFRACLALGSSLMLESELDEAALFLRQAQGLAPMELAPYINLVSIYFSMEQDDEAMHWADRALTIDANNAKVWEIIASIYLYADPKSAGDKVRAKAEANLSYAGMSLAAELIDPNDRLLKAQLLGDAFDAGSREDDFLIEYTAALGLAEQFEKIPQIIFRLEKMEKKPVHWKLFAHGAQAYLAMEKHEEAQELIQRAARSPHIPAAIIADLQRVYDADVKIQ